eukprot:GHVU01226709.1.p1 GENE.GHVU01226709.1~~GHVU01226709.1.p1  ORF type:complete len:198 (-),score=34.50 GHVU01226709.1:696-1289(-)
MHQHLAKQPDEAADLPGITAAARRLTAAAAADSTVGTKVGGRMGAATRMESVAAGHHAGDDDGLNATISSSDIEKANEHRRRGNEAMKEGEVDQALACYSSGLCCNPNSAETLSNRALVYLKKNLPLLALPDAKRATELQPDNPKACRQPSPHSQGGRRRSLQPRRPRLWLRAIPSSAGRCRSPALLPPRPPPLLVV